MNVMDNHKSPNWLLTVVCRLHCNLDTPFKVWSLRTYFWKVAITVYVNTTMLGYRLKKGATSSENMDVSALGLLGRVVSG